MNNPFRPDRSGSRKGRFNAVILAGAAAIGLSIVAPAVAHERKEHDHVLFIGKDGDLLERLIELDAADIEEMRADFAEARSDIRDAVKDVEEAREEVRAVPGAGTIVKAAFATARVTVTGAVADALDEVREELDVAERDLAAADVSEAERIETQDAIDMLRTELAALEAAMDELADALRA